MTEPISMLDRLLIAADIKTVCDEGDSGDYGEQLRLQAGFVKALFHVIEACEDGLLAGAELGQESLARYLDQMETKLSDQLSEILHLQAFQSMEAAWRGLAFLVNRTNFRANIGIDIIDISKENLRDDLEDAPALSECGLFEHTYNREYNQAGGIPFGAIIGNYSFDHSPSDLAMLRNIARISEACQAPFIAAAATEMFGHSIREFDRLRDLGEHFGHSQYKRWHELRDQPESRYLGLCFPRFTLRAPYDEGDHNWDAFFPFVERIDDMEHHILWGNAAFVFATRLTRSFEKGGLCVNICGRDDGGLVDDLPFTSLDRRGSVETYLDSNRHNELRSEGFIPFICYLETTRGCFISAQSVQRHTQDHPDAQQERVAGHFSCVFLMSRLAHYLNILQREILGTNKDRQTLQSELDSWVKRLVPPEEEGEPETHDSWPLAEAGVVVEERPDSPGWYYLTLTVRPRKPIDDVLPSLTYRSSVSKE